MSQHVKAIYGKGVLKPLIPLSLNEDEVVAISIERLSEHGKDDSDEEYLPLIAEDGDPSLSWDEIQAVLGKLPGSLTHDFSQEREERF
jgi:predicted DNA-binding antitoxin AbrB/MazE fold protein